MCYILSQNVLLTPQFGLIACFIPQAIYALFYVKVWDLDFSTETMCVLFGGFYLEDFTEKIADVGHFGCAHRNEVNLHMFNTIIVGSGIAGSVLAHRLAEE